MSAVGFTEHKVDSTETEPEGSNTAEAGCGLCNSSRLAESGRLRALLSERRVSFFKRRRAGWVEVSPGSSSWQPSYCSTLTFARNYVNSGRPLLIIFQLGHIAGSSGHPHNSRERRFDHHFRSSVSSETPFCCQASRELLRFLPDRSWQLSTIFEPEWASTNKRCTTCISSNDRYQRPEFTSKPDMF